MAVRKFSNGILSRKKEEECLVGGHGLDHIRGQRFGSALDFQDDFGDAGQASPSRQRDQSAFDQVLLVRRKIQPGPLLQKLAQELIVERRHERSPENNRSSLDAI
jgi:hypothetical protein